MKSPTHALAAVVIASTFLGWCGNASADQPRMHEALDALRHARHELEMAEHNKGGWRDRAIENVDRAIYETRRGIEHAR